jgi:hypothetical protein
MPGVINLKYKFKKNDNAFMIFAGKLLKGTEVIRIDLNIT